MYMFSLHRMTRLPGPNSVPLTWCKAMLLVLNESNPDGGSPRLANVNTPPCFDDILGDGGVDVGIMTDCVGV